MPMVSAQLPRTADAVVVGGGTVGAWCAYFLRQAGLERGVLVGEGKLGSGASRRAAGGGRGGADAGRRPGGARAGPLVPGLLPPPARRAGHRLRVRPAGVPAALLL